MAWDMNNIQRRMPATRFIASRAIAHRHGSCRRRQAGAVLLTALIMLLILTLLGLSSMNTNILEERMAANSVSVQKAFQAADSVVTKVAHDKNHEGFNLSHSKEIPYTGNPPEFGNFDGNLEYSVYNRQRTTPHRGSGWDSNYAFYHFHVEGIAEQVDGSFSRVSSGLYQVGKNE